MEINKMTYTYRQAGSTAGRAGSMADRAGINGTSRGNALHYENSFADKMADAGAERDDFPGNKDGESHPALYQALPGARQNATANAYTALSAFGVRVHDETPSYGNYETYESANYKIVPDNESGCFTIYNKQGERIGAFSYQDIKIRQDAASGQQFLISEHGTMSYDAVTLDDELKEDLLTVMGIDSLETETLHGYTLKTHSGTGIRYLLKDGEEGRGGKVLLQNEEDVRKYEALAETYFQKYPNLIKDKTAAYIYADLEIKGLAKHTANGIISMGYDGIFYHDNMESKNDWYIRFTTGETYRRIFEWLQENDVRMEDLEKLSTWQQDEKRTERNAWEQSFEQVGGESRQGV